MAKVAAINIQTHSCLVPKSTTGRVDERCHPILKMNTLT